MSAANNKSNIFYLPKNNYLALRVRGMADTLAAGPGRAGITGIASGMPGNT
jgi:hypothetical protein